MKPSISWEMNYLLLLYEIPSIAITQIVYVFLGNNTKAENFLLEERKYVISISTYTCYYMYMYMLFI